tara:strand:+ start:2852 stop:3751 length:900 start_codon:yes stop_codon:yes gene_type:complete
MKQKFYLTILILLSLTLNAQKKHKQDIESIKKMCGCFEISFNFAETFSYVEDSLYMPSKTYITSGLELAKLIVDENNKISIQHILQVGPPSSPYIIKHWRQDWLFENTNLYLYNANNQWLFEEKNKKDVKGQWTQKVYQVDDSPRYEGSGSWVHVDGKSYWENITPAPLPRRELTVRSDYNLTMRGNRHEITDFGWVHDQDNKKIVRQNNKNDVIIAEEKGYSSYVQVEDSRCLAADKWWKENSKKWTNVRDKWNEIYTRNQDLNLKNKVNNKLLYKYLFDDKITQKSEIDPLIESFIN